MTTTAHDPCPMGCGRTTEDPYGGPCSACWDDTPDGYGNCTHCCGEGICMDGSDPLGDCPDDPHRCHACGGSGRGRDQVIF